MPSRRRVARGPLGHRGARAGQRGRRRRVLQRDARSLLHQLARRRHPGARQRRAERLVRARACRSRHTTARRRARAPCAGSTFPPRKGTRTSTPPRSWNAPRSSRDFRAFSYESPSVMHVGLPDLDERAPVGPAWHPCTACGTTEPTATIATRRTPPCVARWSRRATFRRVTEAMAWRCARPHPPNGST